MKLKIVQVGEPVLRQQARELTHKEIVRMSHLAPRTVRYALKKLKENNLIIEKFNFKDARQIIYQGKVPQVTA